MPTLWRFEPVLVGFSVPPYRVLYNQTVNPPEKQAAVDKLPPGTNVRLMVQTLYESLKGAEAYIDSFIGGWGDASIRVFFSKCQFFE